MKVGLILSAMLIGFYGGLALIIWALSQDAASAFMTLCGSLLIALSAALYRSCWQAGRAP